MKNNLIRRNKKI